IKHNVSLQAPVRDLALAKDGTRLVGGVQTRAGMTVVAATAAGGGDVIAFDPPTDPARVAGYIAISPTGKRVVASARQAEGIDVYEVTDLNRKDGLKLVARGKQTA